MSSCGCVLSGTHTAASLMSGVVLPGCWCQHENQRSRSAVYRSCSKLTSFGTTMLGRLSNVKRVFLGSMQEEIDWQ